jgi:hypothetical protein
MHQANTNNSYIDSTDYLNLDYKGRAFDNYTVEDVNNDWRGAFRFFSVLLAMILTPVIIGIVCLPSLTLLFSPLGPAAPFVAMAVFGLIGGLGIAPNIADKCTKEIIRLVSWLKCRSNPEIDNKTYPQKYSPHIHPACLGSFEQQCKLSNQLEREAMQKLYKNKQMIKANPEGWTGLSTDQKERCDRIDLALKCGRKFGFYDIFSNRRNLCDYLPKNKKNEKFKSIIEEIIDARPPN